jgi:hypothetical protein
MTSPEWPHLLYPLPSGLTFSLPCAGCHPHLSASIRPDSCNRSLLGYSGLPKFWHICRLVIKFCTGLFFPRVSAPVEGVSPLGITF